MNRPYQHSFRLLLQDDMLLGLFVGLVVVCEFLLKIQRMLLGVFCVSG